MKLLVIVLCLLSERYLIHRFSYDRFYWFNHYLQKMSEISFIKGLNDNRWLLLILLISPLILVTSLIVYLFSNWFYGLVGFILNLAIFYYCIGPINPFYPMVTEGMTEEEQVSHYFYQVNRQLFSPIFWFMITGPIGLLLYRLLSLCLDFILVAREAKLVTDILEWFPIRMTAFLCLLVGNFQQGIKPFRTLFFSGSDNNYGFISACTTTALHANNDNTITVPLAQNVVNQALIVLLVILALCVNIV